MRFVDTNVLLYAVSALSEDTDKRHRGFERLICTALDIYLTELHKNLTPQSGIMYNTLFLMILL